MNASTYFSTIRENAQLFHEYHSVAAQYDSRDPPDRKPINVIANKLQLYNRRSYKIVDLGCGLDELRNHPLVKNMSWDSVDVVGVNEKVVVADMAALPFEDELYDFAILNRSLWARNHNDVLKEVRRILKHSGKVIICESFRRWLNDDQKNTLLDDLVAAGFEIIEEQGTSIDEYVADVFQYITARK